MSIRTTQAINSQTENNFTVSMYALMNIYTNRHTHTHTQMNTQTYTNRQTHTHTVYILIRK